jgi:hypothetical protein
LSSFGFFLPLLESASFCAMGFLCNSDAEIVYISSSLLTSLQLCGKNMLQV